jgi:hypothetical protein
MQYLVIFIFIINLAHGKECNFERKGISVSPPPLKTNIVLEDNWKEAYQDVFNILCHNLKKPDPFFRGYRAHPGPPYKAAYLWDTAFITQVWLHWDTRIAEELIHYVLKFQKPSGKIHHAVVEIVVKPHAYSESQPPLLSWATWRIYKKSGNLEFLKKVYPQLKLYHQWLMNERQHKDGLFFWAHPYESGIDNSPRFSTRSENKFEDTTKMAAVDLSSYMALSMESLSFIAAELGQLQDKKEFSAQYTKLRNLINEKLWDSTRGMYFDWSYTTESFIHIETISNLTPMVAGIPDRVQAKKMMDKIIDPNYYNTTIPFPSVARNEQSFVKDMWRGPVWINMAYLGVLGVDRYAFKHEARYLARKIVKGIFETWNNTGKFYEFYDPDRFDIKELHRKKGNLWKKITLGSKPVKDFVGWTGLANSLLIEFGEEFPKPYPTGPFSYLAPKAQLKLP